MESCGENFMDIPPLFASLLPIQDLQKQLINMKVTPTALPAETKVHAFDIMWIYQNVLSRVVVSDGGDGNFPVAKRG